MNNPAFDTEQYSIADFDLTWCERYLVAYIELMTRHDSESDDIWVSAGSREFPGAFDFLDILSRSLVTSIVISYSRPWSKSRRGDGTTVRLPKTIFRDLASVRRRDDPSLPLLPFHQDVHARVLATRDRVVAHSDPAGWDFLVDRSDPYVVETRLTDPFSYLSIGDARLLVENASSLRSQFSQYRLEANAKLRPPKA